MVDEAPTPPPSTETGRPSEIPTDDLETELAKRNRRKERNWKFALASALAAAITAWIPSISGWIDAQAERTRQAALVDRVAKEQVSNEEGYKKLASTINQHTDELRDLRKLQACLVEVEVLKEWRKGVDEKLHQRLSIRLPDPEPAEVAGRIELPIEPEKPTAKKLSTKRPEPMADDPKVQQAKEDLKSKP